MLTTAPAQLTAENFETLFPPNMPSAIVRLLFDFDRARQDILTGQTQSPKVPVQGEIWGRWRPAHSQLPDFLWLMICFQADDIYDSLCIYLFDKQSGPTDQQILAKLNRLWSTDPKLADWLTADQIVTTVITVGGDASRASAWPEATRIIVRRLLDSGLVGKSPLAPSLQELFNTQLDTRQSLSWNLISP